MCDVEMNTLYPVIIAAHELAYVLHVVAKAYIECGCLHVFLPHLLHLIFHLANT
jgi:hypothetical protein